MQNKENDQVLIVAGMTRWHDGQQELYCESYEINKEWTACELPPYKFRNSIVWKNRLVGFASSTRIDSIFAVYSSKEDEWSTRVVPPIDSLYIIRTSNLFLNVKGHLCITGYGTYRSFIEKWHVWCLEDFVAEDFVAKPYESPWERMPDWYVIVPGQKELIGTLPANVISTLVTTNTGH